MGIGNKLTVALFALTGFGNPVFHALLKDARVEVAAVFTVKYENPFPYYPERQLIDECFDHNVDCYFNMNVCSEEGLHLLHKYSPDLILVATFKQILRKNVIDLPPLGVVNFHPSLLPRYRGACPSNAALFQGETITGISIHFVTEGLDEGNILLQRTIAIGEQEYDGHLRQKLAQLAGEMVPELIDLFADGCRPVGRAQDHSLASFAPKPKREDGYLEGAVDFDDICRRIRAFNPIPGTSISIGDQRVAVERFEWRRADREDGIYPSENAIDLIRKSKCLRLYKRQV